MDDAIETRTYGVRASMVWTVRRELLARLRLSFTERTRWWHFLPSFTVTGARFALDDFEQALRQIDDEDDEGMAW